MTILQDIRFTWRTMRKNPALTAIIAVTLAFGIGSNATVYSAAQVFMVAPIPGLRDADHLVRLVEVPPQRDNDSGDASPGSFTEWRRQTTDFEDLAACDEVLLNLTGTAEPERIVGLRGTSNYFQSLGFKPVLGRGFLPGEDQPGRDAVAVLSDGFWRRRYAADPQVLGQVISLNGRSVSIVGVMPPDISFPEVGQLWVPLALPPESSSEFGDRSLTVFGRLKAGVSMSDAQAQLGSVARRLAAAHPRTNAGWGARVWPIQAYQARDTRPFVLLLAGAAGLVLVIVCANVANLLLARDSARQREFALRSALGASQWRIFRQRLTESVMLALLGGLLGPFVARGELALIRGAIPGEITQFLPAWHLLAVDNSVLFYTALITLAVGLLFGAGPSLVASRVNLQGTLREGGWGSSSGGRGGRLRRALVVAEMAIALMLLASTGLMVQSFARILRSDPGFRTDHRLTMDLTLPTARYPDTVAMAAFYSQLIDRVKALPGVRGMGMITGLPLSRLDDVEEIEVSGRPLNVADKPSAAYRVISDDFFAVMNIAVRHGRTFSTQDRDQPRAAAKGVVIINEAMAKAQWPGVDPIGQHLRIAGVPDRREREIVGVVSSVRDRNLVNKPPRPEVFVPMGQAPAPSMALIVQTAGDPSALTADVQRQIAALDPMLAGGNVQVYDRLRVRVMSPFRVTTGMLLAFAVLALLLAGLGLYGVIAFAVARRTQEIGIRMALGAQRRDVLTIILGQGVRLAVAGLGIGLAGAFALTRAMASLLFGVSPSDALTFTVTSAVLALVALLASYIPARQATRLDPLTALRSE